MKLIVGFILGIMVASAVAQERPSWTTDLAHDLAALTVQQAYVMAGGTKPDGVAGMIKLDEDGFVICSERK